MRPVPGTRLFLGHIGDARDLRHLLDTGIEAIVDLAANEPPLTPTRELVYLRFPLVDAPGNPPWLLRATVEAVAGLTRADVPTLIYCAAGLSRTPCIAGAALALARGCSPADGLTIVAAAGPSDVAPGLWADVIACLPPVRPCPPA
jgi:hypothetical protein